MTKYVKLNACGSLFDAISLPASSRPLSAMSNTSKEPSWYFELGQEAENLLCKSPCSLSDLDSSDVDSPKKISKMHQGTLESHLASSIKKQKEIKKEMESELSKTKKSASKEIHTLEQSLEGIYRLQSKASIQQEKYHSKIESAKGSILELKTKLSKLEGRMNAIKQNSKELEGEQTELNLQLSHKQGCIYQEELQNQKHVFDYESEQQGEEIRLHQLKLSLQFLQTQYETLVKDIQKLTQSDNPQGIQAYSRQLDAYKIRYQRQVEKFNQQGPRQALFNRQKEVELWKSAVEHARLRNQSIRSSLVV